MKTELQERPDQAEITTTDPIQGFTDDWAADLRPAEDSRLDALGESRIERARSLLESTRSGR